MIWIVFGFLSRRSERVHIILMILLRRRYVGRVYVLVVLVQMRLIMGYCSTTLLACNELIFLLYNNTTHRRRRHLWDTDWHYYLNSA
jgi:hypothetical protein